MILVFVARNRLPLLYSMPVASGILSMMTLALRSPCSGTMYTLLATKRELTRMLPFGPWRRPRASRMPEAQVSTLKPGGSLNLAVGSLSAAVGIGNAGTGAIFMADSDFGRPLAQPGSSAGGGVVWAQAARLVQQSVVNSVSARTCFIGGLLVGSW